VTANRLSALDCNMLVEKITKNISIWNTNTTSYAGRVALINSVVMGIYTFWATIFIFPKSVIKEVNNKCRNFLWGADEVFKKIPYVSWEETCRSKKYGRLGLVNMEAWNYVNIAKLIWDITKKRTCYGLNRYIADTYVRAPGGNINQSSISVGIRGKFVR